MARSPDREALGTLPVRANRGSGENAGAATRPATVAAAAGGGVRCTHFGQQSGIGGKFAGRPAIGRLGWPSTGPSSGAVELAGSGLGAFAFGFGSAFTGSGFAASFLGCSMAQDGTCVAAWGRSQRLVSIRSDRVRARGVTAGPERAQRGAAVNGLPPAKHIEHPAGLRAPAAAALSIARCSGKISRTRARPPHLVSVEIGRVSHLEFQKG